MGNARDNVERLRAATTGQLGVDGVTAWELSSPSLALRPVDSDSRGLGDASHWLAATYMNYLVLKDGATAPANVSGQAIVYVDTADGALKIKFGDGETRTLSADFEELARDALGTALVAGAGVTITPNDGANTITISASNGNPGLVPIAEQTVSGAASVSLTGIDGTYDAYRITGVLKFSAAGQLRMRTSTNAGVSFDSGSSDYRYANKFTSNAPTSADGGSASGTAFIPITTTVAVGNASTDSVSFEIMLFKPADSALYTQMTWHTICNNGGSCYLTVGSGMRAAAADVDAIQFYPDSGTITGAVRVHGVRNS